jgi:hypothetical protein
MTMSVEWRVREGADALLRVDEERRVVSQVAPPDAALLRSYLATGGTGEAWHAWGAWQAVDGEHQSADDWGELVLSRSEGGPILFIDPALFWEGVYRWFRSRGVDFGP